VHDPGRERRSGTGDRFHGGQLERDNTGSTELRRGAVVLAVLSRLRDPQYGYSLKQALIDGGMPIEEGTLYPLLRRLEGQGLLASEWNTAHAPPRRYYRLSDEGKRALAVLAQAWREQVRVMNGFLEEETK
jgi:DNA-binding PadR family transcriptional regulator